MNKFVPKILLIPTTCPITAQHYRVPLMYQSIQPVDMQPVASTSAVPQAMYPVQQPQSSFLQPSTSQQDVDRNTPDKVKREKNKTAVKKHRKKLNEYLKTAPENIRSMVEIEKKLDESIKETENHIRVLRDILAANSL